MKKMFLVILFFIALPVVSMSAESSKKAILLPYPFASELQSSQISITAPEGILHMMFKNKSRKPMRMNELFDSLSLTTTDGETHEIALSQIASYWKYTGSINPGETSQWEIRLPRQILVVLNSGKALNFVYNLEAENLSTSYKYSEPS